MKDPVALLSEYVRIDTANPPGDCREAAELLCGALRESGYSPVTFGARPEKPNVPCHVGGTEAAVLSVHPDAIVVPHMCTGFTDSRFFRPIGIPTYGLMPVLLPRAEHGKIHGVDERIPVAGIGEMTEVTYALIKGWNRT